VVTSVTEIDMNLAKIKPFDIYDFMAGHVRLTKSDLFSVLHMNGRDFYFYAEGSRHELGALDGTGAGCSPCCEEARAKYEAESLVAPNPLKERERELIEEVGFDKLEVRDCCSSDPGL